MKQHRVLRNRFRANGGSILGLARACAKKLLQEDIGLTCIFQLGLLSKVHLAALTKGLSHIGGAIIKLAWEDLKNARFSFFPAAGATFLNPFPNRTPDSPIYSKSQNGA